MKTILAALVLSSLIRSGTTCEQVSRNVGISCSYAEEWTAPQTYVEGSVQFTVRQLKFR